MARLSDYYSTASYGYPGHSLSFAVAPTPKPTVPAAPKFREGDKVNVKIDTTAVIDLVNDDGSVDLKFPDDKILEYMPAKHVTLQNPVNWPPNPGQVWVTPDGKLHGVRRYPYGPGVIVYQIDQPSSQYSDYSTTGHKLDDFKALRPVFVK